MGKQEEWNVTSVTAGFILNVGTYPKVTWTYLKNKQVLTGPANHAEEYPPR